jgi:outer membrane protein assembly factor BamB
MTLSSATLSGQTPKQRAMQILDTTGIKGGLVVHLGCGDGKLTAALRANDSYLVHGLDTDASNIASAREYIRGRGCYGPVCVDKFDGKQLPYSDGIVNLLVAGNLANVTADEVMRVLAPQGVAYLKKGGKWTRVSKPRPTGLDEWTHFLYDSTGNAVAKDTVVGPPRRMQWVGSPRWARSHEHSASLNGLVSSGGRIFYIIDEGSRASIQLPANYVLVARDAFSGVVLWKRPLPKWYNHLFPLKSGPSRLTRRLVAVGDEVYTTPGINEPLSAINAATGKTIRIYDDTRTAEEIIASNGLLLLVVNPDRKSVDYQQENANCWAEQGRASKRWGWDETVDKLMAVEAKTGRTVWKLDTKVVPMSLAADGERVVYHDGGAVVCLKQNTGDELWRTDVPRSVIIPTGWSPSMVMYKDVILFSGQKRSLVVLSAKDGKQLWTSKLHPSGHFCPEDVLVVDGLVWSGNIASARPRSSGVFTGRDPHTGEVKREFPPDVNPFAVMHQRCYPSKATEKYLIPSWIGIEFIDPRTKKWEIHHWVRGGCFYGVMPCNGLIYSTPHACACYYQSKLRGFCVLAPAAKTEPKALKDEMRLERGPAYGKIKAKKPASGDWPTWRHDALRSGYTKNIVPTKLKKAWNTNIGGKLTSLVAADGRLFVASVDEHAVYALDGKTGKKLWSFTTGGRVDSAPTYHAGSVLFGSADGCVYCLRASDGKLAWRFHVAPADRRIVAYEQIESVWPMHGSVLVQNGTAYCLAGRSMFIDGGMRLVRLDARTGRKLSETVLDDRDPSTGQNLQAHIKQKKMPVSLPDVLSSDGKYVYMRSQRFDLDGKRVKILPEPQTDQEGNHHVFSPIGLLDDTWFHRGYWIYGKNAGEGWGEWFQPGRMVPTGRILCVDDDNVYAYGRHPWYLCNSSVLEYRLYAAKKGTSQVKGNRAARKRGGNIPRNTTDWKSRSNFPMNRLTQVNFEWIKEQPPVMAQAMVLADKTLFVAGPPDVDDEHVGWGKHLDPKVAARHTEQMAAMEGKLGGLLLAASAANGDKLTQYKLESVPVFDGMIAADERLYLSMKDGSVLCMNAER